MATAADIIDEARTRLADEVDQTWNDEHLLKFVNSAIRQVIDVKPNSNVVSAKLSSADTDYQNNSYFLLPSDGKYLVEVTCIRLGNNVVGASVIDKKDVEKRNPGWLGFNYTQINNEIVSDSVLNLNANVRTKQAVRRINYAFDDNDPTIFYISPNYKLAFGQSSDVCIRYQQYPPRITDKDVDVPIINNYYTVIFKWVIYEAYMVNSSSRSFLERAGVMYKDFYDTLGVRAKSEMMSDPNINIIENTAINKTVASAFANTGMVKSIKRGR